MASCLGRVLNTSDLETNTYQPGFSINYESSESITSLYSPTKEKKTKSHTIRSEKHQMDTLKDRSGQIRSSLSSLLVSESSTKNKIGKQTSLNSVSIGKECQAGGNKNHHFISGVKHYSTPRKFKKLKDCSLISPSREPKNIEKVCEEIESLKLLENPTAVQTKHRKGISRNGYQREQARSNEQIRTPLRGTYSKFSKSPVEFTARCQVGTATSDYTFNAESHTRQELTKHLNVPQTFIPKNANVSAKINNQRLLSPTAITERCRVGIAGYGNGTICIEGRSIEKRTLLPKNYKSKQ